MTDDFAIAWTDTTWNPLVGCTRKSQACRRCYAETATAESALAGGWGQGFADVGDGGAAWTGKVALREDRLTFPLGLENPSRIFVNSLSDLFHESLDAETIDKIFAVMALAPRHIFQVLTKRPKTMQPYLADAGTPARIERHMAELNGGAKKIETWPLPNVWLGVTAENQKEADRRIPLLLQTPAAVRWIAAEPLLEALDLKAGTWLKPQPGAPGQEGPGPKLDWVVAGGEISAEAQPCHPDWARGLRDQCTRAETPFFWTHWGEHVPATGVEEIVAGEPTKMTWERIGASPAVRRLDGRLHEAFPAMPG
jgi:protein gp37